MDSRPRSVFAIAAGRRSKWVVFLIWLVGIFIAAGPAQLPTKFSDAEDNESTSFLPGDAESTHALTATEELQGGELAPGISKRPGRTSGGGRETAPPPWFPTAPRPPRAGRREAPRKAPPPRAGR